MIDNHGFIARLNPKAQQTCGECKPGTMPSIRYDGHGHDEQIFLFCTCPDVKTEVTLKPTTYVGFEPADKGWPEPLFDPHFKTVQAQ